jgi:hypothetical protein
MSPELINPEMFGLKKRRSTKESDCYAFGMVIYEVLSEQIPFAPAKAPAVMQKVLDGERPGRPQGNNEKHFTDGIWEVVQYCWKTQPHDRISVKAVLLGLEGNPFPSRPSNASGDVKTDEDYQSDTTASDSGMFSLFHSRLVSHYPRGTTEPPIVRGDKELPVLPQAVNPKEGWAGRTWRMVKTSTKKPHRP